MNWGVIVIVVISVDGIGNHKIRDIFSIPDKIKKYIEDKYGRFIYRDDAVLIHIRRGDYVSLQGYHPNLTVSYYQKPF